MALPATDELNGAASTQLTDPPWTTLSGHIYTNGSGGSNGDASPTSSIAVWNADTFDDNQYSEGVTQTNGRFGLIIQGVGTQYYGLYLDSTSGDVILQRNAGNNVHTYSSTLPSGITGDTFKIWKDGSVIHASRNGVEWGSGYTDGSPLTGGRPGLWHLNDTHFWESWEGGNVAGGGGGGSSAVRFRSLLGVG